MVHNISVPESMGKIQGGDVQQQLDHPGLSGVEKKKTTICHNRQDAGPLKTELF